MLIRSYSHGMWPMKAMMFGLTLVSWVCADFMGVLNNLSIIRQWFYMLIRVFRVNFSRHNATICAGPADFEAKL